MCTGVQNVNLPTRVLSVANVQRTKYDPLGSFVSERVGRWRSGSDDGQTGVLVALVVLTGIIFAGSILGYAIFSPAAYIIPVLIGGLMLRLRPLQLLAAIVLIAAFSSLLFEYVLWKQLSEVVSVFIVLLLATGILVFSARRNRSGLPATLGDAMLMDLRDRLERQAQMPKLPRGWHCESILFTADGAQFSGDFFAVDLANDDTRLEVILVDVCGKGVQAGTQSLQLAGAMGGLIGALPPLGLFAAANDYLLRQNWSDGFATAVHIMVDLPTGRYEILSAGHPPALHFSDYDEEWTMDPARGLALGILDRPEFRVSRGVIAPGDSLMIYTDGLVESKTMDVGKGIEWLREVAREAIGVSAYGVTKRIVKRADPQGDDCAVFYLHRVP